MCARSRNSDVTRQAILTSVMPYRNIITITIVIAALISAIERFLNTHDTRDRDYIYTTRSRRVLREWSRTTQWRHTSAKTLNISISQFPLPLGRSDSMISRHYANQMWLSRGRPILFLLTLAVIFKKRYREYINYTDEHEISQLSISSEHYPKYYFRFSKRELNITSRH